MAQTYTYLFIIMRPYSDLHDSDFTYLFIIMRPNSNLHGLDLYLSLPSNIYPQPNITKIPIKWIFKISTDIQDWELMHRSKWILGGRRGGKAFDRGPSDHTGDSDNNSHVILTFTHGRNIDLLRGDSHLFSTELLGQLGGVPPPPPQDSLRQVHNKIL